MFKLLTNKKGFSYVPCCVIILVIVMFVFVSLQYAGIYHIARQQKNETQLKLDGYITRTAVQNFDALKQGGAWENHIDREEIVDGAYDLLGFFRGTSEEYHEVEGKYKMSKPNVSALQGDSFGVVVEYDITIPFNAFGIMVADIIVPVEIVSRCAER